MRNALLVARREYLENIRTRGFWISIFMMPLILVLFALVPLIAESTRDVKRFTVLDESGFLLPAVLSSIERADFAELLRVTGEGETTGLPTTFTRLAPLVSALDAETQSALASAFIDGRPAPTAALDDFITRHGSEINIWWQGLSPDQRGGLSPRISTNHFQYVAPASDDPNALNGAIGNGELFAFFVIGPDPVNAEDPARYVSNNLTDRDLLNWFSDYASREIRKRRLAAEAIDADLADWINAPLEFAGEQVTDTGEAAAVGNTDVARQWAPVVFVYLLWISVLINTQMLLTNTIEEKSNKLIEVLLSSVSALDLMAGKITGIAATGLTIIITWSLMAAVLFLGLPAAAGFTPPIDLSAILTDPVFMGSFAVYFLLGYLLYAAILVGLGSVCNNLKEAQNLMLPVQLLQMVPIFVMVPIGRDPNGVLAQVLSYVPPLTPFIMMNRAAAPPTTFEYITTTVLLIASIAAALWMAAKVFRIGILLSGQPPKLREVLGWLREPSRH